MTVTGWGVDLIYTPENQYDIGNFPFSIGNASSNDGLSIVMLSFVE